MMREVASAAVAKWLDVELQSWNESVIPLRMAEYSLGGYRLFGKFPRQVVLYVGEAPLRMDSELRGPDVWFRYRLIDIRDLDGDRLLKSEQIGDNVVAMSPVQEQSQSTA